MVIGHTVALVFYSFLSVSWRNIAKLYRRVYSHIYIHIHKLYRRVYSHIYIHIHNYVYMHVDKETDGLLDANRDLSEWKIVLIWFSIYGGHILSDATGDQNRH